MIQLIRLYFFETDLLVPAAGMVGLIIVLLTLRYGHINLVHILRKSTKFFFKDFQSLHTTGQSRREE